MFRRALLVAAVAALIAAQTGCRSACGERHSWFSSRSSSDVPCRTVGRSSGCFDTATGASVPCPTGGGMLVPGGPSVTGPVVPGRGPIEVGPMPSLNDGGLIPPSALPVPAPAPGANNTELPFPSLSGTPVKGPLNK
ncbi:hypothetical protein GobsT_15700 [Gemmata obscuriglobus]|nr:hypothetical protein GobsT_15700 [Gemmata obscuriglobus]VTS02759.1 unnamed protein product [Gemmata obscuriglobus UQM 2246]